mmetsp:Transcript_16130/g.39858  ORF Transcript_16130/g.39858 Transcript_16130/m.39858 type:complete len:221 (-) Transcript_16130:72-734(-)
MLVAVRMVLIALDMVFLVSTVVRLPVLSRATAHALRLAYYDVAALGGVGGSDRWRWSNRIGFQQPQQRPAKCGRGQASRSCRQIRAFALELPHLPLHRLDLAAELKADRFKNAQQVLKLSVHVAKDVQNGITVIRRWNNGVCIPIPRSWSRYVKLEQRCLTREKPAGEEHQLDDLLLGKLLRGWKVGQSPENLVQEPRPRKLEPHKRKPPPVLHTLFAAP